MEELEMANQQTEESLETEDVQNETKNKKDKRKKTLQRQEEQSIFDDLPFWKWHYYSNIPNFTVSKQRTHLILMMGTLVQC